MEKREKEELRKKGELRIILPSDLEEEFREEVFKVKGMKKGNLSKSAEEAIRCWIDTQQRNPDPEILEALEDVVSRLSDSEKKRKVAILGISDKTFSMERLVEIYRKGEPIEVARQLKKTLIFNTVQRLRK